MLMGGNSFCLGKKQDQLGEKMSNTGEKCTQLGERVINKRTRTVKIKSIAFEGPQTLKKDCPEKQSFLH
ncbi:hypothetical protein [Fictibacillus barbaricus]|uniref:Uncharacterized protein n=1 Tax=Fictibacillus barbaricus TaxID=182136 RepID=A0ABS2Z9Q3_9BACL|nr:hypothetical protein [Fictibacillus barbaricus]MBN3544377.1 hypothetical protein [Fictibacillus barbaricus]